MHYYYTVTKPWDRAIQWQWSSWSREMSRTLLIKIHHLPLLGFLIRYAFKLGRTRRDSSQPRFSSEIPDSRTLWEQWDCAQCESVIGQGLSPKVCLVPHSLLTLIVFTEADVTELQPLWNLNHRTKRQDSEKPIYWKLDFVVLVYKKSLYIWRKLRAWAMAIVHLLQIFLNI